MRQVGVLAGILLLLASMACASAPAPAAKEKPEKIKVAFSVMSAALGPMWTAAEADLYRKHGLDVELTYIASGTTTAQALISGDIPIGALAGTSIADANLAGADLVAFIGNNNKVTSSLVVRRDIKTPEQLKGKRLGVSRFGTLTDFSARYALRLWKLEPEKDVAIIQVGGVPEILAAMEAGAVDGGPISSPTLQRALKAGYNELLDFAATDLDYPGTALAASQKYVESRSDVIRKFSQGYAEGVFRFKTDKELAKRVMGKNMKIDDDELLEDSYVRYVKLFQDAPYPTVAGMKTVLDELALTNPKAKGVDPAAWNDNRFVKELEDSGFIKKLGEKK